MTSARDSNLRQGRCVAKVRRGPPDFSRTIADLIPECITIVAPDGGLIYINASGLTLLEVIHKEKVPGTSFVEVVAPKHRDKWQQMHRRVCAGEELRWEFEIVGSTAVHREVETHAVAMRLANGTLGQLSIIRDITGRAATNIPLQFGNETREHPIADRTRELEDAIARLEASERSFALLVSSVTDYAIFMLDRHGFIASWNTGAERIKGYRAEEIIGRHFSCFYTADDQAANVPMRALEIAAREGRLEMEGWRVRRDGSRFMAGVIIDPIRKDNELVGFAKVTRDITEKKNAEDQLRQAQKLEAIGQLTGGIAHDFNNLLMAIGSGLELLRKRLPDDQRMRSLLDNAMQGVARGTSLTQRMLAFARRQDLKQEAVDLTSLTAGMTEILRRTLGSTVELENAVPHLLPPVHSDANQLETALLNLVLNARDAMPDGGRIRIDARAESVHAGHPTLLEAGRYVCIAVRDSGDGMDPATLARAAEPFFTTKGVGKGTGLGLSMVDGLVAQSNGKMIIRSEVGKGTAVELWLPVAEAGTIGPTEPDAGQPLPGDFPDVRLSILVVDDDPLVLSNVVDMLEDLGHDVISAASGAKALEVVDTAPALDLVMSDQVMPGMTGLQLARSIHARYPDLPMILATAFGEFPAAETMKIPRLLKPFDQRQLAEAIASVLREPIN